MKKIFNELYAHSAVLFICISVIAVSAYLRITEGSAGLLAVVSVFAVGYIILFADIVYKKIKGH